ncbi:MAG: hypothetical protein KIS91_06540 [Anaerolineae bacterium]|nr:hypothetical protein [Anaerolineae bacterium]
MAAVPPARAPFWSGWHTLGVTLVALALAGLAFSPLRWPLTPGDSRSALVTWWIVAVLLIAFVLILGHGIVGRPLGALIGARNRMSLSRLQLIAWTILVLSAWLTAALWNLANGVADPLKIALPTELWLLLGISATAMVGTPLVLSTKMSRPPDAEQAMGQVQLAAARRGRAVATVDGEMGATMATSMMQDMGLTHRGLVVANVSSHDASLADLFMGDEVGNFAEVDLSKVQMFFFTVMIILAYAAALASMFMAARPAGIVAFPALNESVVALLGISQAGYLTYKAVPHTAPPQSSSP